jgi:hypothetical protein
VESDPKAEHIAAAFHRVLNRLAPEYGMGHPNALPWRRLPDHKKALVIATVRQLMIEGVIETSWVPIMREVTRRV